LDDDDEWLPHKLEVQIEAARRSCHAFPVVTSRFIARTHKGNFVWPKRLMTSSEPLSEYLFTRKPFYRKVGMITTPTLLTRKVLLDAIPFRSNTWVHEDWEWLLRVATLEGVGIEFVPETLGIVRIQEGRGSVSNRNDWRQSLAWIKKNQDIVTPRAYASFVLTQISPAAARDGDWKVFWQLLQEAIRVGRPKASDLLLHIIWWLVPRKIRGWLGVLVAGERRA